MSFKRKQRDHQKINNYVAKHDFNRGGFHGKSIKQQRTNIKSNLSKIDLDNKDDWYDYDIYEDYQ